MPQEAGAPQVSALAHKGVRVTPPVGLAKRLRMFAQAVGHFFPSEQFAGHKLFLPGLALFVRHMEYQRQ